MSISAAAAASTYSTNSYSTDTTSTQNTSNMLGQEDFLKLLVAQMSSQDPLNPQTDTDYIAQMAQFTSLEQTKSITSELTSLRADQKTLQAQNMLGQQVTLQTGDSTTVSGVVSAVQMEAGTPKIVVNGQAYDLSAVSSVAQAAINQ